MIPLDINQHVIHENYITYISDKTVAIIATAGTSETGAVDNITSISKIAKSYGIYFHVDAASGGFIIPFARKLGYKLPDLSLNIPGISSITIDPHKDGLSVIPSGVLVFNDKEYYDEIAFQSFFKLTSINRSLLGTRPGAATIATYAVMKNIGYNGYLTLTKQYFELREHLRHMLYSENLDFLFEPDLNIVTLKHPDVSSFITNMEKSNWIISQSKKYACLRIVLNKNVTIQTITDFFHIYINSISKYEKQNN